MAMILMMMIMMMMMTKIPVNGYLATDERTTEEISEFWIGIKPTTSVTPNSILYPLSYENTC